MMETDTGKIAVGMIPEMDSPANLQVATDILATDLDGNQRLVLEEIDQIGQKTDSLNRTLAEVQGKVTELNSNYDLITKQGTIDLTTNLGSKTDTLAAALQAKHFLSIISTGESSTNIPSAEFKYSPGLVLRRTRDQISIVLFGRNGTIATNVWNGSSWVGWKTR